MNLVKNEGGKLYGYNSDYDGFLTLARKNNIDFSGKRVIIMGSGGAAVSINLPMYTEINQNEFDIFPTTEVAVYVHVIVLYTVYFFNFIQYNFSVIVKKKHYW